MSSKSVVDLRDAPIEVILSEFIKDTVNERPNSMIIEIEGKELTLADLKRSNREEYNKQLRVFGLEDTSTHVEKISLRRVR
ncbi:MAG: hypothetical protein R3F41_00495 [Gammaproteobacteria bacterium]|nr:hypothetical protein [Pseudomonadales bacterium]